MDKCTHEVRLQYWKDIVSKCQARPAGQSAEQWMKENGICKQTYYLWQRRIRQEAYDLISSNELLPAVPKKNDISDKLLVRILQEVFHA